MFRLSSALEFADRDISAERRNPFHGFALLYTLPAAFFGAAAMTHGHRRRPSIKSSVERGSRLEGPFVACGNSARGGLEIQRVERVTLPALLTSRIRNCKGSRGDHQGTRETTAKAEVTVERVLKQYARIAFADIGQAYDEACNLVRVPHMPEDIAVRLAASELPQHRCSYHLCSTDAQKICP